MSDDGLSQREKRMQRHQQTRRAERPKKVAKGFGTLLVVVVALGVVSAGIYYLFIRHDDCPDPHWHGTFAVYYPGAKLADGTDTPVRVDYAAPRAPDGQAWFQLGESPKMDGAMHMHQSGDEVGSAAHGPAQFHYEADKCVRLDSAFSRVDTKITADGFSLYDKWTEIGKAVSFPNAQSNASQTMHYWLQHLDGRWENMTADSMLGRQLLDGQACLLAFGNFNAASIKQMQDSVPAPISRGQHVAAGDTY